jgi:hypothetical protein
MAIVREEKVVRNNTDAIYEINDTQTMIAFEPNSDTIWFNGKPHDYDTLNPVFARENTALQTHNLQRFHALTQNQILSPYPVAYTALDQGVAETNLRTYHYQAFNSKRFNLDKGSQSGNIISFTSAQGVKHHLIWYPVLTTGVRQGYSQYNTHTCRYILIEGDNWQSPAAITTGAFTGVVAGGATYHNNVAQIWPIAVDPVNKFIYCAQVVAQNTASYGSYFNIAFTKSNSIVKCPFTTRQDVGGTLAISSGSGNMIGNIFTYSQHDYDPNPIFYCGLNNDNTPMFLTQVENETVGYTTSSGIYNNTTVLANYPLNRTQWTAARTNTSPRVYWDKLSTGTQTNVASQNVSANNWGGTGASKPMYRFAPSKFESSTAAGETDIKYSYNLCYDSTGNVPGLNYYKWNRATPASSTSGLMTIDWAGQTTTDMIAHPFLTAEANGSRTMYPEFSCANVFLTKHGSRYFINVLHTHGYSGNMTLRPANSKRLTTFEVDTSTWTACTWVASISVAAYSFMSLDDNATKIAVIRDGGVDVYSSNNGVWSITATEPGAITCLGRDQSNRLWALDQIVTSFDQLTTNNDYNSVVSLTELKPKIRLVSESLPNRVNIVLNDRNLTYSGSNISTSAAVNAYNTSGSRIATTVYLKLSGVNAVFTANGSTELSVTTSSSADLTVPITVTGSGYIQIAGSFAL